MSFGISDPVTGELAANKANKDGSDLTNPATWRTALGVPSLNALDARPYRQGVYGLASNSGLTQSTVPIPDQAGARLLGVVRTFVIPFRSSTSGAEESLICSNNYSSTGLEIRLDTSNRLQIQFAVVSARGAWSLGNNYRDGRWHILQLTVDYRSNDGTVAPLLVANVDGVEVTPTVLTAWNGTYTNDLSIGWFVGGRGNNIPLRADSAIGEFAILNYALTQQEMQDRYNRGELLDGWDIIPNQTVMDLTTFANNAAHWTSNTTGHINYTLVDGGGRTGVVQATIASEGGHRWGFFNQVTVNQSRSFAYASIDIFIPEGQTGIAANFTSASGYGIGSTLSQALGNGWTRYYVALNRYSAARYLDTARFGFYITKDGVAANVVPIGANVLVDNVQFYGAGAVFAAKMHGLGRQIADLSNNRRGLLCTSFPAYVHDSAQGEYTLYTNATPNQQLGGGVLFDANNRYRITSWTVTADATATISLGNASAGAQYVSGLALTANVPTAVPLLTQIAATQNLWVNSNSAANIKHVIRYERID